MVRSTVAEHEAAESLLHQAIPHVALVGSQPAAQPRGTGRGQYPVRRQNADREFQLRTWLAANESLRHRTPRTARPTQARSVSRLANGVPTIHRSSFRIHRFLEKPVISRVKNTQHSNTTLKFTIFPTIPPHKVFELSPQIVAIAK